MKTAVRRPAQRAGELFSPPHRSADAVAANAGEREAALPAAPAAIGRLREEARTEIDRLISFLDATEADAELEPSLGWPEVDPGRLAPGDAGVADDREADDDFEDEGRVLS